MGEPFQLADIMGVAEVAVHGGCKRWRTSKKRVLLEIVFCGRRATRRNAIRRHVATDQFKGDAQGLQPDPCSAVGDAEPAEVIAHGDDVETRDDLLHGIVLETESGVS